MKFTAAWWMRNEYASRDLAPTSPSALFIIKQFIPLERSQLRTINHHDRSAYYSLTAAALYPIYVGHPWRWAHTMHVRAECMRELGCTQVCMCLNNVVCMQSACFCESRVIRAAAAIQNTSELEIYLPRLFYTESCFVLHLKCNARSLMVALFIKHTPQHNPHKYSPL